MNIRSVWLLICGASVFAGCHAPSSKTLTPIESVGIVVQDDAHVPLAWRSLTDLEQASFDIGYAVFNTGWTPANTPPGRRDGLGPLFNAQSCDACHNSRRRGRGPRMDGEAPADLVIQLGKRLSDGTVERGIEEYGRILNTSAIEGFTHDAAVHISYEEQVRVLDDGTHINLRKPRYQVTDLSGAALPSSTVLMPRMPPMVQGVGLLELVPQSELDSLATREQSDRIKGHVSRINTAQGIVIGRFGWQATEPTVAAQTASAFAREMGLTTPLLSQIDCGHSARCDTAAVGGTPEVEAELFSALVFFQQLHAVPAETIPDYASQGQILFDRLGCSACHRNTLPVTTSARASTVIHPYTDLLLHELGEQLADRDVEGKPVRSEWRTAPLWGLQASVKSNQPLRLLHDGRARSIEEAILWHEGEALNARERYARLSASERTILSDWIAER